MTTTLPDIRPRVQAAGLGASIPAHHPSPYPPPYKSVSSHGALTPSSAIDLEIPPNKRRKLSRGTSLEAHNAYGRPFKSPTNAFNQKGSAFQPRIPPSSASVYSKEGTPTHRSSLAPSRPNIHPDASGSIGANVGDPIARSTKPYLASPPSMTLGYKIAVGYFPWVGHHPEDILNEQSMRNGYYDKAQTSQTESSTARPSMWNSVKHKAGLNILSSFFASTLQRREFATRISNESTFKLPPRVTLTDTKRETWLKGLSNPCTPLRGLSRSIPHGIRGRNLLEQCLNKEVSVSRAVWLAKCVGANEIRAFKRKGAGSVFVVGGELKWVKDWTTNVEQFMQSILEACGTPTWKEQFTYGLRLTDRLFSADLLDQEQFANWVIRSVSDSDVDRLSAWLVFLQSYWQDFVRRRREGRRLVLVLLDHLRLCTTKGLGVELQPLARDLAKLLRKIMVVSPASLIIPSIWSKYEDLIDEWVIADEPSLRALFLATHEHNARLQHPNSYELRYTNLLLRQRLMSMFESLSAASEHSDLALQCLQITSDHTLAVRSCFQWSSRKGKSNMRRLYTAIHLIRLWTAYGVNVEGCILDFLGSAASGDQLHRPDICKLLSELARSGQFSIGRYCQWLMANGTFSRRDIEDPGLSLHTELLQDMPLHGCAVHVVNLRNSLLRKAGASVPDDSKTLERVKTEILLPLAELWTYQDPNSLDTTRAELKSLSQRVKSASSRWLRNTILFSFSSQAYSNIDVKTRDDHQPERSPSISPSQFRAALNVLVATGEFSTIAEIMERAIAGAQYETLVDFADTINRFCDIFEALGAGRGVFQLILEQISDSNDVQPSHKALLESLHDLASRFQGSENQVYKIPKQTLGNKVNPALAACSPISDTMLKTAITIESALLDELELMFEAGTTMDLQTLSRVFHTLTGHIVRTWSDAGSYFQFINLLMRLQTYSPTVFGQLIADWLEEILMMEKRPSLLDVFLPIVCCRILSLDSLLVSALSVLQRADSVTLRAQVAVDVLLFLIADECDVFQHRSYRTYRFFEQRSQLISTHSAEIIHFFHYAIGPKNSMNNFEILARRDGLHLERMRSLLDDLLCRLVHVGNLDVPIDPVCRETVGHFLLSTNATGDAQADLRGKLAVIWGSVSDCNLITTQFEIGAILTSGGHNVNIASSTIAELLVAGADSTCLDRVPFWIYLLSTISHEHGRTIRKEVEIGLFDSILHKSPDTSATAANKIQNLLTMFDALTSGVADDESDIPIEKIASAISSLLKASEQSQSFPNSDTFALISLDAVLHLLVAYAPSLHHSTSDQTTAPKLRAFMSLARLHHRLEVDESVKTDLVLDVLGLLADCLSEDQLDRCCQVVHEHGKQSNCRLNFLSGHGQGSSSTDWLCRVFQSTSADIPAGGPLLDRVAQSGMPYGVRKWELISDATPNTTENDTSLSLGLFGAQKSVL